MPVKKEEENPSPPANDFVTYCSRFGNINKNLPLGEIGRPISVPIPRLIAY
jgi:hypothetical protein